eukprot:4933372-Alexandrium_andersonii.AAC.1
MARARPPPSSVASAELADTSNQQVERGLMFVYGKIVFHCWIGAPAGTQLAQLSLIHISEPTRLALI